MKAVGTRVLLAGADEGGGVVVTTAAAAAAAAAAVARDMQHSPEQRNMILLRRENAESSCLRNRNSSRVAIVCRIASLEVQSLKAADSAVPNQENRSQRTAVHTEAAM